MGACSYCNEIVSHNIRASIRDIIKEDEERNGSDPYLGTISTVSRWSDWGTKTFKTKQDVYNFEEEALNRLDKRCGAYVNIGLEYYAKSWVSFKDYGVTLFEYNLRGKSYREFFKESCLGKTYIIVSARNLRVVNYFSKIVDAKEYVNYRMFNDLFEEDYYILSKSRIIYCTGEGKVVSRKFKSTDKYLCVPYYRYLLIAWCSE